MATQNLKKTAKSANAKSKEARKETESYKMYNARRRMKRSLQRELDKLETAAKEEIEGIKNKISSLQANIQQSYATKSGEYLINTKRFIEQSKYELKRANVKDMRNNELFKREINQASIGGISKFTKEEVKIFYAATQNFWKGKPQGQWNEAIMDAFGVSTLEEAWDKVFATEEAKEALRQAKAAQEKLKSEQGVSDGTGELPEEKGSPTYIKGLILSLNS